MNFSVRPSRRRKRVDVRPALLWFVLTGLLLSVLCAGAFAVRAVAGEWLELKAESARVRVFEMLPKPAAPDFVPTPLPYVANAARPTIVWRANVATRTPTVPVHTEPTRAPETESPNRSNPAPAAPPTEPRRPPNPTRSNTYSRPFN